MIFELLQIKTIKKIKIVTASKEWGTCNWLALHVISQREVTEMILRQAATSALFMHTYTMSGFF